MPGPRVNSPSGGPRYTDTGTPGHSGTETEPREGNARLTAGTAVVLFVLLAAEGVTALRIHGLLTPHVVIGLVLVPVVLVELGSVLWRVALSSLGDAEYRCKARLPC